MSLCTLPELRRAGLTGFGARRDLQAAPRQPRGFPGSCPELSSPRAPFPLWCFQIYPDPELEAQVLSLTIRCIHSEEGCRWSGTIRHLQVSNTAPPPPALWGGWMLSAPSLPGFGEQWPQEGGFSERKSPSFPPPSDPFPSPVVQAHLGTCSYNVVPCPNRCGAKLSRRDLPPHLQHDCPQRHLQCEFCRADFTGEAFEVSMGGAGELPSSTVVGGSVVPLVAGLSPGRERPPRVAGWLVYF